MPVRLARLGFDASQLVSSKASISAAAGVAGAISAARLRASEEPRVEVMFIILVVSLFAVSFPTISREVPSMKIPAIIFFIGKHFGTGVILSTAFIHLLADAFESLNDWRVEERYGRLGKWTGGIILASLLSIFLIEYISTGYVEYLQEKPPPPPTPIASEATSRSPTPTQQSRNVPTLSESTPILPPSLRSRTLPYRTHARTRSHSFPQAPFLPGIPVEVLSGSPRMRLSLHSLHSKFESDMAPMEDEAEVDDSEEEAQVVEGEPHAEHHRHHEIRPIVGRSRQVVGLLVLQFGIMIHSFVIGLTLSVTSGSDFTSLTTAIIFHQLFEGLSLGIRIAALPPAHEHRHKPHLAGHSERWHRHNGVGFLTPTLSVLFALTTPVGLALGMLMWKDYRHTSNVVGVADEASMLFTQGIMSSVSAGMLIYSATVEMIAGDFVYGDVDGHNHHQQQQDDNEDNVAAHDNGQTHGHSHELTGSISISGLQSINGGEANQTRASVWKKALAVLSLFAGSGMMVLIALAE